MSEFLPLTCKLGHAMCELVGTVASHDSNINTTLAFQRVSALSRVLGVTLSIMSKLVSLLSEPEIRAYSTDRPVIAFHNHEGDLRRIV
jgi:hypothetical protein